MIEIVPYDASWPEAFAAEAGRIRARFGDRALRVEHVGSTAVTGLAAKPVIDVQVSVASLGDRGVLLADMGALDYAHVDLGEFDRVYPFFKRPAEWPSTHHVHLCEAGGEQERRHLAFRDYLRRHADAAAEYRYLKEKLSRFHAGTTEESREAYSLAKSAFVEEAIVKAFAEGLPELDR